MIEPQEFINRPLKGDDEYRIDCPTCQDSGWRTVWHPKSLNFARRGKLESSTECLTTAVTCTCKHGDKRLNGCNGVRFDPRIHFAWSVFGKPMDHLPDLLEWLSGSMDRYAVTADQLGQNPYQTQHEFGD